MPIFAAVCRRFTLRNSMPEAYLPKLPNSKPMRNTTNSASAPNTSYHRSKSISSKPSKPSKSGSAPKNNLR